MLKGDARACFAAVRLGERRIGELAKRFGAEVVVDAFRQLGDRSEQAAVERLRETFQPGSYRFTDSVDPDGQGNGPYRLSIELTVDDNGVVLDFSDSDDQAPGRSTIWSTRQSPAPCWACTCCRRSDFALNAAPGAPSTRSSYGKVASCNRDGRRRLANAV